MHFAFTEDQELLRTTARDVFRELSPMSTVRKVIEEPAGYSKALWQRMANLGWLGLTVPETYGGAGLSFVDLVPLLEEMGRALVPSPFLSTLQGTLAVLLAGSEADKLALLPAVCEGRCILTLAVTESAGTEEAADINCRAKKDGAGFRLSGPKAFVADAAVADKFVVLAREDAPGDAGLSWFIVERGAAGTGLTALTSMDQTRRLANLSLEGTPAQRLGAAGRGFASWQQVRDRVLVALSADAVGGMEAALNASVEYVKQRVQFGRPVGVHQAVKHRCALMLVELEAARSITYYAAWSIGEASPQQSMLCAMAKARATDAYRKITMDNIQNHGGVGFTWEYDCHLFYKRAKAMEVTYGDASYQRERVVGLSD
jgi:alkylation response protein AidB-like acyl-CoA dehydrogenase